MKKLSTIIALLTLFLSNLLPVAHIVRAVEYQTTDVVIHKIKLDSVKGWPRKANADGTYPGENRQNYDGSKIENLKDYFGESAEELDGVSFTYWKVTKDQYETMVKDPGKYDTTKKVSGFLPPSGGKQAGPITTDKTADSQGVTVRNLAEGYYWFVENIDSYVNQEGFTLAGAAAVPFGLALPVYKADGSQVNPLHVYPKNTIARPKIDKDFEGQANADKPQSPKEGKSVTVGDTVRYEIQTIIPANTSYETAQWSDQMTEGLTFNPDSVSVMIDGKKPSVATAIDLRPRGDGFVLKLEREGLREIQKKAKDIMVKITYSATVNDKAIIDVPESNDVTFHYGHHPTHGNTPVVTKPKDKKIKVTKRYLDGGEFPEGVEVIMTLYNAKTGAEVSHVKLHKGKQTHEFQGLDNDTQYKVVENMAVGYTAEYQKVGGDGEIEVVNHKENNPPPLRPEEPKVVTGGARFQKVDQSTLPRKPRRGDLGSGNFPGAQQEAPTGLKGAVFYVKNDKDEYLAKKDEHTQIKDQNDYDAKENLYQGLVKTGAQEQEITKAKAERDAAYRTASTLWKFQKDINGAYEVTSGDNGYFHVYGLAYGQYKLEEKTAPAGYAKLTAPVKFEVKVGSASEISTDIYPRTDEGLQLIGNKKITIPQTGGIGTAIFTVIGLSVMTFAFVALRRNRKEDVA